MFLLKSHRPTVYRDRWEGKLDTTAVVAEIKPENLRHLTTAELEQASTLFRKMVGQSAGSR